MEVASSRKAIRQYSLRKKTTFIVLSALILFVFLQCFVLATVSEYGDDVGFRRIAASYPYFGYIISRYLMWSSRLTTDSALYFIQKMPLSVSMYLWRILDGALIIAYSYSISRITLGPLKNWTKQHNLSYLVILFLTGYLCTGLLLKAFFWKVGSINYLWPTAFALLAFVRFSDYFLFDAEFPSAFYFSLAMIAFIWAGVGHEQVALIMLGFSVLMAAVSFYKKSLNWKLCLWLFLSVAFVLLHVLSPGNNHRFYHETHHWFPAFSSLTFEQHLFVGYTWMINTIFHTNAVLIFLLSLLATVQLYFHSPFNSATAKYWYLLPALALGIFIFSNSTVHFSPYNDVHKLFFDFQSVKLTDLTKIGNVAQPYYSHRVIDWFPYIFWSIYFCFLVVLSCVGIADVRKRTAMLFCYIGAVGSLFVMFFSPTIYASGVRTSMVFDTLMLIGICFLLSELKNRLSLWLVLLVLIQPVLHFLRVWHILHRHNPWHIFF